MIRKKKGKKAIKPLGINQTIISSERQDNEAKKEKWEEKKEKKGKGKEYQRK